MTKVDTDPITHPSTGLLVETLKKRWKTYRDELKRCNKEPGEKAIHDLRVATRRMLALVDLLRAFLPHPRLRKLRRTLKDQLDSLDELRDVQVMLVEVSRTIGNIPELEPYQKYLVKREKRLVGSTAKAIRSFKVKGLKQHVDSTSKALQKKTDGQHHQQSMLAIVDHAYENTLQRMRAIEPEQSSTIHRVRIAFKKFRYMVEIIQPLVPTIPDDNFKKMHAYQTMMGDIQDLEIFSLSFDKFAKKHAPYDPEPVRQHYQQQHTKAIDTYIGEMNQIDAFWRQTPDAPFPWEKRQGLKKPNMPQKPEVSSQVVKRPENGEQVQGPEEDAK